jgi:hypothetical protein
MGGIGKTTLALHVAKDLADSGHFSNGILWIPLENNPAPETVAVWILTAFGIEAKANPQIQLAQLLNQCCPLLILDDALVGELNQLVGGRPWPWSWPPGLLPGLSAVIPIP